MKDQPLAIDYLYLDGDLDDLRATHEQSLERDGFEVDQRFVQSAAFDTFELITYETIDDKWYFDDVEAFEYRDNARSFDLGELVLLEYVTKPLDYLQTYAEEERSVEGSVALTELVSIVTAGYEAVNPGPLAVYSQTPDHAFSTREIGGPPVTAESLAHDRLTYLPWLTIFTPAMVETYGRDTLLSAPAWHIEELDDGAILVVCHDDLDWETSIESVADHIGLPAYTSLY